MSRDDAAKFIVDLHQELSLSASQDGSERGIPEAFTEYMFDVLTEAGEIDGAEVAMYEARAARASGFAMSEDESTLWLFLTDYRGSLGLETFGKSHLESSLKRLRGFLQEAVGGLWRHLEETSPAWDMAQRVAEAWSRIGEIRLEILTNADLRTEVQVQPSFEDRPVHVSVWDATRLQQLLTSGRAQEPISINVVDTWGEPIPCLGPEGDVGTYVAYLAMLPGEFIARIYEEHGPRLLELNVRSFLQSRGKVNRGIQETIKQEPRRFLAYNNGVSMTAAEVKVVRLPSGGIGISEIHDLQIVNGGQTSASLHYAKVKAKLDLSDIFVQAKLSVVNPAGLMDLVPLISQFANSQNKVNMADFSANDPFHVEVEKLSRSVWAPGQGGVARMTRWFYERARGQYADAHARERTPAKQREFKAVHPLSQKFTKTDLAKFENTWDQLPWIVSFGAERNFREFMVRIQQRRGSYKPDQDYFELLVAKAILFRSAEKLVGGLQLGGYRAQAVTYTIAKLAHVTKQRLDLRAIWRSQELPQPVNDAILDLAPQIHQELLRSAGSRNVSEWAKKEDCWKAILDVRWDAPASLTRSLAAQTGRTERGTSTSVVEMYSDADTDALMVVRSISAESWFALSQWAKQTSNLQPWQRGLAFSLGRLLSAGSAPSRKQAAHGALILTEARRLGFAPEPGSDVPADVNPEPRAAALTRLARGDAMDLPAGTTSWTVSIGWKPLSGDDADVIAIRTAGDDQVTDDSDFVFYNHRAHPDGSVSLTTEERGRAELSIHLALVPAAIHTVHVLLAAPEGSVLQDLGPVTVRVVSGEHVVDPDVGEPMSTMNWYLVRFVRRAGSWRLQSIGVGDRRMLAQVAVDHGVAVDD